MFSAYKSTNAWDYLTFKPNFFYTIFCSARETIRAMVGWRPWDKDITVNYAIPLVCLALLLGCSIYLLYTYRGKGVPLGVFGLCSLVFFSVNSTLLAVHRYSLPCLTIYIALTLIYANRRRGKMIAVGCGIVMLAAQSVIVHLLLVTNDFAG
jgi:hypothetical protein